MTLSSSLDISTDGLIAQSERMKVYANNIANVNTPYFVRKIPILQENNYQSFETVIQDMKTGGGIASGLGQGGGGVLMPGVALDNTPGKRLYEPGHPQADKDGYITLSNVNPMIDMSDAMSTSRLYEANLAVIGIVKAMATRAVDIGRG